MKLCETLPADQNFKLYVDNFFTFLELQLLLKRQGILSTGTIRANRLWGCTLKTEKDLKKEGRGASDCSVDANSGMSVVRWYDSKAVQLSSTLSSLHPVSTVKRWDKKTRTYVDVPCPAIVNNYNQYMGGVDLFYMLMALYRTDHRSQKWYRRIFYWAIHLSVVNGWLLYRRHCEQKKSPRAQILSILQFTANISESLIKECNVPLTIQKKRGRPSRQGSIDAFDGERSECEGEDGSNSDVDHHQPKKRNFAQHDPATNVRNDDVGHFAEHAEPK